MKKNARPILAAVLVFTGVFVFAAAITGIGYVTPPSNGHPAAFKHAIDCGVAALGISGLAAAVGIVIIGLNQLWD